MALPWSAIARDVAREKKDSEQGGAKKAKKLKPAVI